MLFDSNISPLSPWNPMEWRGLIPSQPAPTHLALCLHPPAKTYDVFLTFHLFWWGVVAPRVWKGCKRKWSLIVELTPVRERNQHPWWHHKEHTQSCLSKQKWQRMIQTQIIASKVTLHLVGPLNISLVRLRFVFWMYFKILEAIFIINHHGQWRAGEILKMSEWKKWPLEQKWNWRT